jgi:flagellar motor switch protein FliN/FliY
VRSEFLSSLDGVEVEISVVIGRAKMPIQQLLRMGRGAVIELDAGSEDDVWVYANNRLIARGEIQVNGEAVKVQITEMLSSLVPA